MQSWKVRAFRRNCSKPSIKMPERCPYQGNPIDETLSLPESVGWSILSTPENHEFSTNQNQCFTTLMDSASIRSLSPSEYVVHLHSLITEFTCIVYLLSLENFGHQEAIVYHRKTFTCLWRWLSTIFTYVRSRVLYYVAIFFPGNLRYQNPCYLMNLTSLSAKNWCTWVANGIETNVKIVATLPKVPLLYCLLAYSRIFCDAWTQPKKYFKNKCSTR